MTPGPQDARVLITGGAGFIGSHLAECMLALGCEVTVLDDLSTGSLDNLSAIAGRPGFAFIQGSVLDAPVVETLVEDSRLVVHLAAAVGVRYILEHPLESIKTNVDGTEVLLASCARFGIKVMVASTSEVYGKNAAGLLCETSDSVLGPSAVSRWSYATAKKLDEFLALGYAHQYGLPVIVTRFFNIVGPRQAGRYGMVLPNFVRAALLNEPIRVFGDGRQSRNFTFIHDCIEALLLLLAATEAEGQVFNIGGREEISILDLAERVKRLTGSTSPIVRVPYHIAYPEGGFEDMGRRVPCLCRIERLTGWAPSTPIDEMIEQTVCYERWRAANPSPTAPIPPHEPAACPA
jgi:UDP-glucose 4-epimerase